MLLLLSTKSQPSLKYFLELSNSKAKQLAKQLKVGRALKPPLKAPLRVSPPSNRVFVGGIPAHTTEQELLAYFGSFGILSEHAFPSDETYPSRNRGFAFITFEKLEDASKVVHLGRNHLIRAKVVSSSARRSFCRR